MNWLQIRFFGPYFNSFLPHSYGYAPANELKSVLEGSNFRFSPYSPTAFWPGAFFPTDLLLEPLLCKPDCVLKS